MRTSKRKQDSRTSEAAAGDPSNEERSAALETPRIPIPQTSEQREAPGENAEPVVDRSTESAANEEEVRTRAYEIYLSRGGSDGDEVSDWLSAEQQVRRSRPSDDSNAAPAAEG